MAEEVSAGFKLRSKRDGCEPVSTEHKSQDTHKANSQFSLQLAFASVAIGVITSSSEL